MDSRFVQFIQEKKYLVNVSAATVLWYEQSLRWLANPAPDEAALKDLVVRMRDKGMRPASVNSRICAVNAYLRWAGSPLKIPKLKTPQVIPPTFTADDIKKLAKWKPKGFYQTRLHVLILTLLDTGCRIGEALNVRWTDVDLDNLLLRLHGKGGKDRLIPFSFELRRHLWRLKQLNRWDLVFTTGQGQRLQRRNLIRNVKDLCKRLGIVPPARTIHAFRHTFAVNYLRKGGSVFHLQKMLGHSTLEMTRRYANLMTEDLQQIHEKVSLLSGR